MFLVLQKKSTSTKARQPNSNSAANTIRRVNEQKVAQLPAEDDVYKLRQEKRQLQEERKCTKAEADKGSLITVFLQYN